MATDLKKLEPLIDMDLLVYRCGFAADSEVKREGYDLEEIDYLHNALHLVNTTMEGIIKHFSVPHRGFISGDGNFREQIATIKPYKGNRDDKHKPKYYKDIQHHLIKRWNAEVIHGREADDALGTVQWSHKDLSTIIVSTDKDLDMIPGHHYNWVKKEFYWMPLKTANLNLFRQMLEGDLADNIPGIYGIGKITVNEKWQEFDYDIDKIRSYVQEQYQREYGENWKSAYEEVARLLWIERVEGKGCPYLWS